MALIQCRECNAKISDSAKSCPACGSPLPKKTSAFTKIVLGLLGLGALIQIFSTKPTETASPKTTPVAETQLQIATRKADDAAVRVALLGAKKIKEASKNPDSFKLTKAFQLENGTLCYEFRATNSFNAIVPGYYTITPSTDGGSDAMYNKYCAGKFGRDFTYIKSSL